MDSAALLGLVLGGAISIVSSSVTAILTYFLTRRLTHQERRVSLALEDSRRQMDEIARLRPSLTEEEKKALRHNIGRGGQLLDRPFNLDKLRVQVERSQSTGHRDMSRFPPGGWFACFPIDAEVLLPGNRSAPLSSIAQGDEIVAFNHGSLVRENAKVTEKRLGQAARLIVINDCWRATDNQQIFANGRYVPAIDLTLGDTLVSSESLPIVVTSLAVAHGTTDVASLEVPGPYGYFVGALNGEHILVREAVEGKLDAGEVLVTPEGEIVARGEASGESLQ